MKLTTDSKLVSHLVLVGGCFRATVVRGNIFKGFGRMLVRLKNRLQILFLKPRQVVRNKITISMIIIIILMTPATK